MRCYALFCQFFSASASKGFLGLESFMAESSICSIAEIHVFVNDC